MKSADLLRLLGDPTRLRLLRVLAADALNVSELTGVLGLAQSGVSRHLGLLREAGLVTEERAGGFTWYRQSDALSDPASPLAPLGAWLTAEFNRPTADTRADDARLEEVRRVRKESFATHGDDRRQLVPGRSWPAWARAIGLLLPPMDVADLGCGEGYLTMEAARWATRVIAIDRAKDVLDRGKALAKRRRLTNITWKRGEIERVPLPDASVDLALLSQALHHAEHPVRALQEAHRILRPGGRVLILDLRDHRESWVTSKLGDRWLGFAESDLDRLLREAGFSSRVVRVGARRTGDPFKVLIASGMKDR